jgi:hypothetical protein
VWHAAWQGAIPLARTIAHFSERPYELVYVYKCSSLKVGEKETNSFYDSWTASQLCGWEIRSYGM